MGSKSSSMRPDSLGTRVIAVQNMAGLVRLASACITCGWMVSPIVLCMVVAKAGVRRNCIRKKARVLRCCAPSQHVTMQAAGSTDILVGVSVCRAPVRWCPSACTRIERGSLSGAYLHGDNSAVVEYTGLLKCCVWGP